MAFSGINLEEVVRNAMDEIQQELKDLKHVNIIIVGKSGVGKSTLINALFREPLARTGLGRPVTQQMELLTTEDMPLRIYDTKGLELGEETREKLVREVHDLISEKLASKDEDEYIHAVWYCINTMSNRIERQELEFINQLSLHPTANVPVLLVLTQSLGQEHTAEMEAAIAAEKPSVVSIIPVLAKGYPVNQDYTIPAYGLDRLIRETWDLLPESARIALNNAQIADLSLKQREARKIIRRTAASAFGIGAMPIPMADAPLLISTQTVMLAKITSTYGMKVSRGTMTTILSAVIGTGGATVAGRTITGSLLKLIPGAGSVIGGAVSGSTAGVLTLALGETYMKVLDMMMRGEISQSSFNTSEGRRKVREIFRREFHIRKKKLEENPSALEEAENPDEPAEEDS